MRENREQIEARGDYSGGTIFSEPEKDTDMKATILAAALLFFLAAPARPQTATPGPAEVVIPQPFPENAGTDVGSSFPREAGVDIDSGFPQDAQVAEPAPFPEDAGVAVPSALPQDASVSVPSSIPQDAGVAVSDPFPREAVVTP